MSSLVHFLLVFSHAEQRLLDTRHFASSDEATKAYRDAEEKYRGRSDLEIVLVGADSLATIQRTHGHYFMTEPGQLPALV